jgi:structural maintenance of chromosome 3 (chondroitin sulfate proteoglycan 6)
VNRKALDQYLSFNEQRETLLKKKQEMKNDTEAIHTLIESLDLQKDEAINRTFTSVSKHFSDVFQELVPNGYGKLIMKTAIDEEMEESENKGKGKKSTVAAGEEKKESTAVEEEESEEEEEETEGKKKKGKQSASASKKKKGKASSSSEKDLLLGTQSIGSSRLEEHNLAEESKNQGGLIPFLPIDSYRGIQVLVAFNKATGESFSMQQLSGGQKALVALALIFAIQRCDPAPFYLFDEIDQALDATYRKAVASLIHRQANSEESPAQFITTTFRPELLENADMFFGISLTNKVSRLLHLQKVIKDFFSSSFSFL